MKQEVPTKKTFRHFTEVTALVYALQCKIHLECLIKFGLSRSSIVYHSKTLSGLITQTSKLCHQDRGSITFNVEKNS